MRSTDFFATHQVFTHEEYLAARGAQGGRSPRTADSLLTRHASAGKLLHVRRGLYAAVPAGTAADEFQVDPFLLATKLAPLAGHPGPFSHMTRRSKDWNEGLAEELRDPEFAREFLTAAVEDGVPLKTALGQVIRAMGVKEFAETVGLPSPNLLRAIDEKHNPTQQTLEKLLAPFGLRIGLTKIKQDGEGEAA